VSGWKGSTFPGATGLMEHAIARGQRDRVGVAVATHPWHRAEVVVEGPVLLHQHDDMLHVADRARPVVGLDGRRPSNTRREQGGGCCSSPDLKEPATADRRQMSIPLAG
jgi:hypothetical protein